MCHTKLLVTLKQVTTDILASASDEGAIKFWNITNGKLLRNLGGHTKNIEWSLDMLNAQTLVSGSWDQTIKLWNWQTGNNVRTIQANVQIRSLAVITTPGIESITCKLFNNLKFKTQC